MIGKYVVAVTDADGVTYTVMNVKRFVSIRDEPDDIEQFRRIDRQRTRFKTLRELVSYCAVNTVRIVDELHLQGF